MIINILSYLLLMYISVWITLFFHELAHAVTGWYYKVCKSPFSIGYLPVLKLPMTPLINYDNKKLSKNKKILINISGLFTNFCMFLLGVILVINLSIHYYFRIFILFFIFVNFAELTSYVTFGAIKPISGIKYIIELTKISKYKIYIPGFTFSILGLFILYKFVLKKGEIVYLFYYVAFYLVFSFSRTILTKQKN